MCDQPAETSSKKKMKMCDQPAETSSKKPRQPLITGQQQQQQQQQQQHEDEGLRDWSDLSLLDGPLENIAGRLNTIDHFGFRSVCTSWRKSSPQRPKTPFLIVTRNIDDFRFYDHVRNENIPVPLGVAIYTARYGYVYTGCSFGWIALGVECSVEKTAVITLINPFSSTAARVTLSVLNGCMISLYSGRVLLSGSPGNLQQPPPMVVFYSTVNYPRQDLKFQKIGDKDWKTIQNTPSFVEVIACKGRFYGFTSNNQLYSIDLQANNGNGSIVQLTLDLPPDIFFIPGVPPPRWKFLANFSGDLVVVTCSDHNNERQYLFLRVDFENMRLVLMPRMADDCLLFQFKSCSFFYNRNNGSLLAQYFNHDGRHIVHTGNPNHVIIIFAEEWQHPDPRIRSVGGAWALGWITPELNMEY